MFERSLPRVKRHNPLKNVDRIVLSEARAYALLGESHPLAGQPTVTLEQLASEPLVLFDQAPSTNYAMSLSQARGLVPNIRHPRRTASPGCARSPTSAAASIRGRPSIRGRRRPKRQDASPVGV